MVAIIEVSTLLKQGGQNPQVARDVAIPDMLREVGDCPVGIAAVLPKIPILLAYAVVVVMGRL